MVVVLLCLVLGLAIAEDRRLVSVVVIYRHGDRTPVDPYPTDPYKDRSNWPVGFGQLTPRGKMMQFNLGKYLRKTYGHLLGETYDENVIHVRSTDVDRTLMSAQSNLAGLYPPTGNQVWNNNLMWQPIPVHTVPQEEDNLLSSHAKCPKQEGYLETVLQRPEIVAIQNEYKAVFEYVAKSTGADIDNMFKINYIYDTLYIEQLYNKTLPDWTHKVFPERMQLLRDTSFKLSTWTHEMKRLRSGPLVQNLLDHFKGVADKRHGDAYYKLLMYSGHDTTISSFLNALGMFDPPIAPTYASMVAVELFEYQGTYQVRFLYRNESDREPYKLNLYDCPEFCPLEQFDRLTENIRPNDWQRECGLRHDPVIQAVTVFSVGVTSLLLLVLLVAVIVSCTKKSRSQRDYRYFSVNQA